MFKKSVLMSSFLFVFFIIFNLSAGAEDSLRSVFIVDNISCGSCIRKIDAKLKILKGYRGMLANIDKKMVIVDHKTILRDVEITVAMTSIGKPARLALKSEYDRQKTVSMESKGWRSPSDGFIAKILKIFSP